MASSAPHPYRSPAVPEQLPKPTWLKRLRKIGPWLLLFLAAFAGIGYWIWTQGAQRRAVEALPSGERRLLYSRTLENLKTCHGRLNRDAFHKTGFLKTRHARCKRRAP
jgi:hypothetical protein